GTPDRDRPPWPSHRAGSAALTSRSGICSPPPCRGGGRASGGTHEISRRGLANEGADGTHDLVGALDVRKVAAGENRQQPRPGQALEPSLRVGGGEQLVLVPPDELHRRLDAMQPALEIWVEEPRLPGEAREGEAVLDLEIGELRRHRRREDFLGEGLVVIEVARL